MPLAFYVGFGHLNSDPPTYKMSNLPAELYVSQRILCNISHHLGPEGMFSALRHDFPLVLYQATWIAPILLLSPKYHQRYCRVCFFPLNSNICLKTWSFGHRDIPWTVPWHNVPAFEGPLGFCYLGMEWHGWSSSALLNTSSTSDVIGH